MTDPQIGVTERTRIRRLPENTVQDVAVLHAILDAGRVAHIGMVQDGQPFIVPVAYARRDNHVLFHGSTGSRLFRTLAEGAPTCLAVTLLDGLVLARSAFESSMNYRSVLILGTATRLSGDDELDALRVITEHLLPGRWSEARQPTRKERAATMTLALGMGECSVKVREGAPDDDPDDLVTEPFRSIWAGVVPMRMVFDPPEPDELTSHIGTPTPAYIAKWTP
jgi:nitroimidazol reductase NimA-like FMN-containing flavoprotein (pyridoxamine 5'-phosphate oxidase superfamily)